MLREIPFVAYKAFYTEDVLKSVFQDVYREDPLIGCFDLLKQLELTTLLTEILADNAGVSTLFIYIPIPNRTYIFLPPVTMIVCPST